MRSTLLKIIITIIVTVYVAVLAIAQPPVKTGGVTLPNVGSNATQQIILGAAQNIFIGILRDEINKKSSEANAAIFSNNKINQVKEDSTQLLEKINKKANSSIYKNAKIDIQLSSLSTEKFARFNNISWSTNEESYVGGYIIERTTDYVNFIAVGTCKATNSSNIQTYCFTDYLINDSSHYAYRLRIIGANAQSHYSSPITFYKAKGYVGVAFATDTSTRQFILTSSIIITKLQLINADGKAILNSKKINLLQPLNFATLAQGTYTLKLYSTGGAMTQLFIKLN